MANNNEWPPSHTILAFGATAVAIIISIAYALKVVLPVIATAAGLFVAASTSGLATAGAVGSWVAPFAAMGIGTTGAVLSVHLLMQFRNQVEDKPFDWGLPLAALAGGLLLNLWKDLVGPDTPQAFRLLVGGIVALWIVVAGVCYKREGWRWKSVAVLLYVLLPLAMLARAVLAPGGQSVDRYFAAVELSDWLVLGGFFLIGVLIAILEWLDRRG